VRGVGEQRAEGDDGGDPELLGLRDDLGDERAPPHVRLDAAHEHEVAFGPRRAAEREAGGRPVDGAADPVDQTHRRARHLEVVVVLGVDGPELGGVPVQGEVLDRGAGRVTRVVPALERTQHDRVGELTSRDPGVVGDGHADSVRVVTRLAVRPGLLGNHVTIA
jgi:hypothetical protein